MHEPLGHRVLLMPGRGTRLKGHADAIELLARVRASGIDASLWLPGAVEEGREHYLDELRARAQALGVLPQLRLEAPIDDMPATGATWHSRRVHISSVVKCGEIRITPRPVSFAAAMYSRPVTSKPRSTGFSGPHQARRNSNTAMPSEAKCARNKVSRAFVSSSGKQIWRLRRATRRRAIMHVRISQPSAGATARASPHGQRASVQPKAMPTQAGQVRGESGGASEASVTCGF